VTDEVENRYMPPAGIFLVSARKIGQNRPKGTRELPLAMPFPFGIPQALCRKCCLLRRTLRNALLLRAAVFLNNRETDRFFVQPGKNACHPERSGGTPRSRRIRALHLTLLHASKGRTFTAAASKFYKIFMNFTQIPLAFSEVFRYYIAVSTQSKRVLTESVDTCGICRNLIS